MFRELTSDNIYIGGFPSWKTALASGAYEQPDRKRCGDAVAYRRLSPFQQIPSIDDDGLVLSESAAIIVHLPTKSGRLIPGDRAGKAQVLRWCLAAMSSVEPPLLRLVLDYEGSIAPYPRIASYRDRCRITRELREAYPASV